MWEGKEQILERLRNQPIYSPPQSPTSVFLIPPQLFFSLPPPLAPQLHFSPPPTISDHMSPYLDFSPTPTISDLMSPYLDFSPPPTISDHMSPYHGFSPPPTISDLMSPYLDFSPPPTISDLMSPYLDFSPPPPPPPRLISPIRFLFQQHVIPVDRAVVRQLQLNKAVSMLTPCIIRLLQNELRTLEKVAEEARLLRHARSLPRLMASTDIGIRQCHSSLMRNLEDSLLDFYRKVPLVLKDLIELLWWLPLKPNTEGFHVPDLVVYSLWEAELAEPNIYEELFEEMTQTCESLPLECFLPPKSTKMVSIWSCLSVVKISRKISIQLLQALPSVQLPQTLHIVIVEEKMTQLLSCSGEFISQTKDCSVVEERSVEITVEVDATNNGAHGVKAYENFPIVSHLENKNTRDKLKRNYKSISVITREDLEHNFGSSREAVANSFGVSVSTMKRICRKHGISRWPFQPKRKKERLMEVIAPSMHEKHDSRLRCIQTPLHARSSPRTIALLDGGEMVQLDSSKQKSLVEFDVTNNSAHLLTASQSCSTISHSDETNSRETLKRKSTTESVLSFEDLQRHFGCKRDDAAKALGVSISTVKRTCRQHEIPRWPSRKKKKVSKTDYILLEQHEEKDVSPTCSKMPIDGQTERGNEMVGHLHDQNEGPNLSNTKNGSNEESITTLMFQDSVSVSEMDYILLELKGEKNVSSTCKTPTVGIVLDFIEGPNLSNIENHLNEEGITTPTFQDSVLVLERDCILLEPQGEKNVSPTHKTRTHGQTEVGNGMVGHIQNQNGIVPEFIVGPNLLNTKNRSNDKSLTTPNFQDSVPGNWLAMDFSISSTYEESGEPGGPSELAFQPKELTPSTAYPNPKACVFTQPHISLREMLLENVGSSRDSRNFSTSALGFFMGGHVSESSWTMPLCSDQAPMQTMTTTPHTTPHLTEKQDIRTVTFKAQYRDKKIKFRLSLPSGIVELKKQVTNRLGELGGFEVHYQDSDNEWILIGCDADVWDCFELSSSSGNEVVRLLVRD